MVNMEKRIQLISFNRPAPVEDFNGPAVVVAFDDHFRAEGISLVGGYESIAGPDFMAVRCDTV